MDHLTLTQQNPRLAELRGLWIWRKSFVPNSGSLPTSVPWPLDMFHFYNILFRWHKGTIVMSTLLDPTEHSCAVVESSLQFSKSTYTNVFLFAFQIEAKDWSGSHVQGYKTYEAMFRIIKESENVDERQHCFLIQTTGGESRYFSMETRADLLRLESAWHRAVCFTIADLGVRDGISGKVSSHTRETTWEGHKLAVLSDEWELRGKW